MAFAKREKGEALMFDWLKRHKQAVSPRPQADSINVNADTTRVVLEKSNVTPSHLEVIATIKEPEKQKEFDEKPILHVVYPIPFRSAFEQQSYSVRLMMGFCSGCKAENKLLCTNHTARLYGCFKRECSQKLVKVTD